MKNIPFNLPPKTGKEINYIEKSLESGKLSGNGFFTKECESWLEKHTGTLKALLTSSCTASLELSAILCDIGPEDEVIVPSYTFVSTANAFVLRGAKIIFVDIDPSTMNMSIDSVKQALSPNTKAVVPVHYAGVGCDMDALMELSEKHKFWVIEDAAQALMTKYRGQALGTIGHLGCFSFHETKNYTSGGEGGALFVNDKTLLDRAEIIREKGTDRSQFLRGNIDKYTWRDIGSSFLMSELQAAYLFAQLDAADHINISRLKVWNRYYEGLLSLAEYNEITLPFIPEECEHNAHMFYIKLDNSSVRSELIAHLKDDGINAVFHYIPLHSSPAGQKYGVFVGEDEYTSLESSRLLRLPIWYGISNEEIDKVIFSIRRFFA